MLSFGKERLEQSGKTYIIDGKEVKSRKKTNNKWFETQDNIRYWNDFSKQKITWGNLCLSPQYAFVEEEYFINAPSPMIVPGDKYILAILNSKVGDFYIRQLGVSRSGGYFEYKPMFVEKIPIPTIDNSTRSELIKLVDIILQKKYTNLEMIEDKINKIIFNIYNLTNKEIAMLN